jgi:hypothetical protein
MVSRDYVAEALGELIPLAGKEPPRPLMRESTPAEPFPVDALGETLANAARAIHDRVQAPLAIGAQSVLGAATLVTQAHADIELPIGGKRIKPISSYFITIAGTGERKTECDYQANWAIRKFEGKLRENHDAAVFSYTNDKLAWDKARGEAVNQAKGNRAAIKLALDRLGLAPTPPLEPMLTSTEPTLEGLIKQFPNHFPSLGIFSSEGGQFVGGHGMNEDNKLKTASGLSALWDGEPVRRVRAGDGASIFSGRRLAAHLMVQPEVASLLFQDRLLAGQGLLARLLTSAPDSAAGTRQPKQEKPETAEALKVYGKRLLDILESPLPLVPGKINELKPRTLLLSIDAADRWRKFVGHVEQQMGPGGPLEQIRGLANKLPEHAARLASAITLVADIKAEMISDDDMKRGITLAEHYAGEALRVFEISKANVELLLAQRLLDWLHRQWGAKEVSLPDVYQRGPNAIRDKATANRMVTILADHGWLVPLKDGAVIDGKLRRVAWQIVEG